MYGQDAVPKGLEGEDSSESSFFSATDVDEQEDTSDDDGGFNFSKYGMPDDEAMEGEDVNDTVYMPAFDSFATYSEGRGDDSSSLDSITVPASAPPTTHNNEFSEDEESFDFLAAMDGPAGNTQPMHSPARVDEGGVEGCMSPMAAEAHTMDLENRSKFASLPKPLHACMTHILGTLETLVGPNEQDMALCELHRKARRLWGTLFEPSFPRDKPLFLFRDGPITQAAKAGTAVLLEDLNLPSQAVVERLNPLLEPNPEFNITEDITCSANHGGKVLITPGFQVIATCHRLGEFERLQLSPATRSRFTEIAVPGYSKEELQSILKSTLDKRLPPEGRRQSAAASEMVDHLFRLWDELRTTSPNQAPGGSAVTMRSLFHLADFLASTGGEFANARPRALLVASRFFLLDHLPREQAREIASKWWGQVPWASHDGASPAKQVQDIFGAPVLPSETQSNWSSILRIREADRRVQLAYTGVSTCYKPGVRLPSLGELVRQVSMSATATVVTNMARLFVAIGAHAPLLLEGPPGIGKTEIVRQVCGLLGYHYERINLAASTTKDQLFGCIVPRFVDGRHVFEWQDGKLTAALKSGSWILLDEINLAAPEVLDGLSPLLVRDSQPYQLPGQDKLVDLFNTRIFATMNPASVGGSRNKLPRSVANLFMRVLLDEYPPEELRKILDGVYQDLLPETTSRGSLAADCVLVPKELDLLFKLHMDIKGRVARRELGRTGGPFELNLRDLTKLRDVLKNASKDLKHHYRFFAANDGLGVAASAAAAVDLAGVDRPNKPAPPSAEALQDGDIRVIALRKFVELVYSQRFMDPSDQRLVRTIIDTHFPEGGTVALSASAFSIDMGTPGFVRIGAVYLKLGDVPTPDMDARGSLVHTPGTTHQLEMLAAACQSGRPVLLQGDTGTRKTSLVQELARIARRQLVVMNMSDDTDIGDVIGQWLPVPAEELHADLSKALLAKFDDAIVVALTIGAPALKCASGSGDAGSANALIELVLSLADAVEARLDRSSVPHPTELDGRDNERPKAQCIKVAELRQLLKAAQVVSRALQKLAFHPILRSEESVKNVHIELMRTHRELQEAIRQAARMAVRSANAEKQGHTFTFVESPLVKAAREGHWVLLDNINSAPQDVVERLNPLLEEKPELVIYEGPSAVARTNVEVHRDFRLFATANVRRHGSHKLSSALLNRMICLHMPPLDAGLAGIADVDVHDMFGVVCHRLGGIHAGRELARVLMRFHGDVQGRIASGALSFCAEFVLTFRVMDNTATMIQTLVRRPLGPLSPVSALVWAIYRNYVASIASELQQQEACRRLAALLEAADLRPASQTYAVPPASRAGTLEEWEAVLERVTVAMCGVEETTAQLACALLLSSLTGPLKMAANLDVIFACARNLHGGLLRSRQGERARELWDRMSAALVGRNVPELRVVLQALCRDMASQVDPWGPPLTLLQKQVGAVFALVAIEFLAGVSFKDAGKRAAVLRRLVALAHRLKAAIPQPRSLGLTGMAAKVAQQARQCVDHLGGFQLAETALDVLSGRALLDILSDVNHGLDETHNRGAAFALQRVLTIPVDAVPPLLLRMDKTLRSQVTMKVPTPFLLSVTWAASSWRLVRQIASPLVYLSTEPDTEEEPLTVSSLMECEMGLCIAACMPRFQAVVGGMLDLAGKARQVEKDRTKRLADFEGELRARGQEMAALKAEAQVASEERVRKKKQLKRAASEAAHEALQQEVDQLDMLLARCVKQCDLKQAEIEAAHHACQQVRQEGAVKSVQESFAGIKASWADLCGFEPWKRMASLADSVILEMQADAFVVLSRHHSKMDAACANATVSASSALSELSGSGLMPWVVTVSQDAVWQGLRALWLGVFMTPVILPHIKQGIALQLHVLRGECPSRIAIASILDDGSAARYPRILFLITPADSTRAVTALFLRQPREAYFFKPSGSLLVDRVVEAALVTFQPGVAIPNSVLGQGCGYRAKEYNVEWLTTDAAQVGLSLEEEIACLLARMAAKLTHLASVTSGLNSPPRRGDQALSGATVAESIGAAEASLRLVAREVAARPGPASQWQILADCQDLLRRASSVPGTLTAMEDSIWVTQKGSGEAIRRLGFTSLLGATEDIVRSKIEGMIRLRLPKGAVGRSHARKVLGSLFQTGEIPATCTVALKALDDASEKTLAERDAAFRMFYGLYCVFSILGRMAAEMGASDAEWKGLKQWWHETPRLLSLLEKDVLNAVLARVRVERGPTISLIQKVGPMDWRAVQGKLDEALTILGLSSEARASRGLSDLFERLWPLCDEGVTPAIPASSGSANVETRDQARKKELAKRCKSQLDEMISAVDKAQPKPYHILQPARELRAYFHRRLQQLDEKDGSSVSENDLKRHSARVSHYQALWEEHRKTKEGGNQVLAACLQGLLPYRAFFRGIPGADHLEALRSAKPVAAESPSVRVSVARMVFQAFADLAKTLAYPSDKGADSDLQDIQALLELSGSFAAWAEASRLCRQMAMPGAPLNAAMSKATVGAAASGSEGKWANGSTAQERLCFLAGLVSNELPTDMEQRGLRAMEPRLCAASLLEPLHRALAQYRATRLLNVRPDFLCGFTHVGKICAPLTTPRWSMLHCYGQLDAMSRREQAVAKATSNFACGIPLSVAPVTLAPVDLVALFVHDRPDLIRCAMDWQDAVDHAHGNGCDSVMLPPAPVHLVSTPSGTPHEHQEALDANPMLWSMMSLPPPKPATLMESLMGPSIMGSMQSSSQLPELLMNFLNQLLQSYASSRTGLGGLSASCEENVPGNLVLPLAIMVVASACRQEMYESVPATTLALKQGIFSQDELQAELQAASAKLGALHEARKMAQSDVQDARKTLHDVDDGREPPPGTAGGGGNDRDALVSARQDAERLLAAREADVHVQEEEVHRLKSQISQALAQKQQAIKDTIHGHMQELSTALLTLFKSLVGTFRIPVPPGQEAKLFDAEPADNLHQLQQQLALLVGLHHQLGAAATQQRMDVRAAAMLRSHVEDIHTRASDHAAVQALEATDSYRKGMLYLSQMHSLGAAALASILPAWQQMEKRLLPAATPGANVTGDDSFMLAKANQAAHQSQHFSLEFQAKAVPLLESCGGHGILDWPQVVSQSNRLVDLAHEMNAKAATEFHQLPAVCSIWRSLALLAGEIVLACTGRVGAQQAVQTDKDFIALRDKARELAKNPKLASVGEDIELEAALKSLSLRVTSAAAACSHVALRIAFDVTNSPLELMSESCGVLSSMGDVALRTIFLAQLMYEGVTCFLGTGSARALTVDELVEVWDLRTLEALHSLLTAFSSVVQSNITTGQCSIIQELLVGPHGIRALNEATLRFQLAATATRYDLCMTLDRPNLFQSLPQLAQALQSELFAASIQSSCKQMSLTLEAETAKRKAAKQQVHFSSVLTPSAATRAPPNSGGSLATGGSGQHSLNDQVLLLLDFRSPQLVQEHVSAFAQKHGLKQGDFEGSLRVIGVLSYSARLLDAGLMEAGNVVVQLQQRSPELLRACLGDIAKDFDSRVKDVLSMMSDSLARLRGATRQPGAPETRGFPGLERALEQLFCYEEYVLGQVVETLWARVARTQRELLKKLSSWVQDAAILEVVLAGDGRWQDLQTPYLQEFVRSLHAYHDEARKLQLGREQARKWWWDRSIEDAEQKFQQEALEYERRRAEYERAVEKNEHDMRTAHSLTDETVHKLHRLATHDDTVPQQQVANLLDDLWRTLSTRSGLYALRNRVQERFFGPKMLLRLKVTNWQEPQKSYMQATISSAMKTVAQLGTKLGTTLLSSLPGIATRSAWRHSVKSAPAEVEISCSLFAPGSQDVVARQIWHFPAREGEEDAVLEAAFQPGAFLLFASSAMPMRPWNEDLPVTPGSWTKAKDGVRYDVLISQEWAPKPTAATGASGDPPAQSSPPDKGAAASEPSASGPSEPASRAAPAANEEPGAVCRVADVNIRKLGTLLQGLKVLPPRPVKRFGNAEGFKRDVHNKSSRASQMDGEAIQKCDLNQHLMRAGKTVVRASHRFAGFKTPVVSAIDGRIASRLLHSSLEDGVEKLLQSWTKVQQTLQTLGDLRKYASFSVVLKDVSRQTILSEQAYDPKDMPIGQVATTAMMEALRDLHELGKGRMRDIFSLMDHLVFVYNELKVAAACIRVCEAMSKGQLKSDKLLTMLKVAKRTSANAAHFLCPGDPNREYQLAMLSLLADSLPPLFQRKKERLRLLRESNEYAQPVEDVVDEPSNLTAALQNIPTNLGDIFVHAEVAAAGGVRFRESSEIVVDFGPVLVESGKVFERRLVVSNRSDRLLKVDVEPVTKDKHNRVHAHAGAKMSSTIAVGDSRSIALSLTAALPAGPLSAHFLLKVSGQPACTLGCSVKAQLQEPRFRLADVGDPAVVDFGDLLCGAPPVSRDILVDNETDVPLGMILRWATGGGTIVKSKSMADPGSLLLKPRGGQAVRLTLVPAQSKESVSLTLDIAMRSGASKQPVSVLACVHVPDFELIDQLSKAAAEGLPMDAFEPGAQGEVGLLVRNNLALDLPLSFCLEPRLPEGNRGRKVPPAKLWFAGAVPLAQGEVSMSRTLRPHGEELVTVFASADEPCEFEWRIRVSCYNVAKEVPVTGRCATPKVVLIPSRLFFTAKELIQRQDFLERIPSSADDVLWRLRPFSLQNSELVNLGGVLAKLEFPASGILHPSPGHSAPISLRPGAKIIAPALALALPSLQERVYTTSVTLQGSSLAPLAFSCTVHGMFPTIQIKPAVSRLMAVHGTGGRKELIGSFTLNNTGILPGQYSVRFAHTVEMGGKQYVADVACARVTSLSFDPVKHIDGDSMLSFLERSPPEYTIQAYDSKTFRVTLVETQDAPQAAAAVAVNQVPDNVIFPVRIVMRDIYGDVVPGVVAQHVELSALFQLSLPGDPRPGGEQPVPAQRCLSCEPYNAALEGMFAIPVDVLPYVICDSIADRDAVAGLLPLLGNHVHGGQPARDLVKPLQQCAQAIMRMSASPDALSEAGDTETLMELTACVSMLAGVHMADLPPEEREALHANVSAAFHSQRAALRCAGDPAATLAACAAFSREVLHPDRHVPRREFAEDLVYCARAHEKRDVLTLAGSRLGSDLGDSLRLLQPLSRPWAAGSRPAWNDLLTQCLSGVIGLLREHEAAQSLQGLVDMLLLVPTMDASKSVGMQSAASVVSALCQQSELTKACELLAGVISQGCQGFANDRHTHTKIATALLPGRGGEIFRAAEMGDPCTLASVLESCLLSGCPAQIRATLTASASIITAICSRSCTGKPDPASTRGIVAAIASSMGAESLVASCLHGIVRLTNAVQPHERLNEDALADVAGRVLVAAEASFGDAAKLRGIIRIATRALRDGALGILGTGLVQLALERAGVSATHKEWDLAERALKRLQQFSTTTADVPCLLKATAEFVVHACGTKAMSRSDGERFLSFVTDAAVVFAGCSTAKGALAGVIAAAHQMASRDAAYLSSPIHAVMSRAGMTGCPTAADIVAAFRAATLALGAPSSVAEALDVVGQVSAGQAVPWQQLLLTAERMGSHPQQLQTLSDDLEQLLSSQDADELEGRLSACECGPLVRIRRLSDSSQLWADAQSGSLLSFANKAVAVLEAVAGEDIVAPVRGLAQAAAAFLSAAGPTAASVSALCLVQSMAGLLSLPVHSPSAPDRPMRDDVEPEQGFPAPSTRSQPRSETNEPPTAGIAITALRGTGLWAFMLDAASTQPPAEPPAVAAGATGTLSRTAAGQGSSPTNTVPLAAAKLPQQVVPADQHIAPNSANAQAHVDSQQGPAVDSAPSVLHPLYVQVDKIGERVGWLRRLLCADNAADATLQKDVVTVSAMAESLPEFIDLSRQWSCAFVDMVKAVQSNQAGSPAGLPTPSCVRRLIIHGISVVNLAEMVRIRLTPLGAASIKKELQELTAGIRSWLKALPTQETVLGSRLMEQLRAVGALGDVDAGDGSAREELRPEHEAGGERAAAVHSQEAEFDPFSHLRNRTYKPVRDAEEREDLDFMAEPFSMSHDFSDPWAALQQGQAEPADPRLGSVAVAPLRHLDPALNITLKDLNVDFARDHASKGGHVSKGGEDGGARIAGDHNRVISSIIKDRRDRREVPGAPPKGPAAADRLCTEISSDENMKVAGPKAEMEGGERVMIRMRAGVSAEHIAELMKGIQLYSFYKDWKGGAGSAAGGEKMTAVMGNLSSAKGHKRGDKWTYERLAECRSMQGMINEVLRLYRRQFETLYLRSTLQGALVFEWVILLDNSGSMAPYQAAVQETLVLLLEVLRKLEIHVAVARFGDSGSHGRVILKRFEDPYSAQLGQKLLESMSYTEASFPVSGLEGVADRLFSSRPYVEGKTHRAVLMVTDALSNEIKTGVDADGMGGMRGPQHKHNFKLAMMQVRSKGARQQASELTATLQQVCGRFFAVLEPEAVSTSLANTVSTLVAQVLQDRLDFLSNQGRAMANRGHPGAGTASREPVGCDSASSTEHGAKLSELLCAPQVAPQAEARRALFPVKDRVGRLGLDDAIKAGTGGLPEGLYTVSVPGARVPGADAVQDQQHQRSAKAAVQLQEARRGALVDAIRQLDAFRAKVHKEEGELAVCAQEQWAAAQCQVEAQVCDLVGVFEDAVFPFNKFTRRQANDHGVLYMPGLIRAICSDWQYKKVFATKQRGGKREYAVAVAIDISVSMEGHLQECAVETLIVLLTSLQRVGIEAVSILTFGSAVRLVKAEGHPWDAATAYALLNNLHTAPVAASGASGAADPAGLGTCDATAIHSALDLLESSSVRGPKKVFVLTDGYSTQGLELAEALLRAEVIGIDVIGMTVGLDRTVVPQVYQKWLTAAIPSVLPDAIRHMWEREAQGGGDAPEGVRLAGGQDRIRVTSANDESIEDILKNFHHSFRELAHGLSEAREGALFQGNAAGRLTVDIAFAMDITESMTGLLDQAKRHIVEIIANIQTKVLANAPTDIVFRYAFVGYRDFEAQANHFAIHDFAPFEALAPEHVQRGGAAAIREFDAQYQEKCAVGVQDFLAPLEAKSWRGCDFPEDVLGALQKVADLSWESKVRYCFLIGDAPAHGTEFHDFDPKHDNYPNGHPYGLTGESVIRALSVVKRVRLYMCHMVVRNTRKMFKALHQAHSLIPEDPDFHHKSKTEPVEIDLEAAGKKSPEDPAAGMIQILDRQISENISRTLAVDYL
eukprot:jgi/Mesvir1/25759/Mv01936-RA.3